MVAKGHFWLECRNFAQIYKTDMQARAPQGWIDYEMVDCGGFEKLERFGKYHLIRPEPQAVWSPRMSRKEWENLADASFVREKQKVSYRTGSEANGGWTYYKKLPQNWEIGYPIADQSIRFKLSFTSFGHIGVFPEQADNWQYIYHQIQKSQVSNPKVLNLFAYTGGASLAARAAGADVTHLDSVKQVVNWSAENMTMSKLDGIRWLVEDAFKYVQREVKRGKTYQGIILDPPAYGRGPTGEKWVLEEGIDELIKMCAELLAPKDSFLVLSLYSLGFSSLIADNLVSQYIPNAEKEFGEFYIPTKTGFKLPLGTFLRLSR